MSPKVKDLADKWKHKTQRSKTLSKLPSKRKEAVKRRKTGKKVRIVESRNVKFFGGDIAYFIYQKNKGD